MAVQAGNDLVLIPNNPRDLHRRIVQLIKEKSKSSEKVIASIKKIIRLKICLGLL
jgi:beta-glucosidase-like glycosyl hydrolase